MTDADGDAVGSVRNGGDRHRAPRKNRYDATAFSSHSCAHLVGRYRYFYKYFVAKLILSTRAIIRKTAVKAVVQACRVVSFLFFLKSARCEALRKRQKFQNLNLERDATVRNDKALFPSKSRTEGVLGVLKVIQSDFSIDDYDKSLNS